MLIYEVNLTVEQEVSTAFGTWLHDHIGQMLTHYGFSWAEWFEVVAQDPAYRRWVIHYWADTEDRLNTYLNEHAATVRQEGTDRFGARFTAELRILKRIHSLDQLNPDEA